MINTGLKNVSYLDGFDRQVAKFPNANALTYKTLIYTYKELALQSKTLALALKNQGINAGDRVAVGISRNETLVPLLLAIWSLRAAYIPVDPSFPLLRQNYILETSHPKIAILDNSNIPSEFNGSVIKLNELLVSASAMPLSNDLSLASDSVDGNDVAYIIYTSGSTGNPKGVAVSQANLINFIESMSVEPGLNDKDRLLAITTISFDIHILEIFLPLFVGAHLILTTKEESIFQHSLRKLIDLQKINVMQATPATWRLILENGWKPKRKLKILIGGEAFPVDLKRNLINAATEVWNMYGPTETTVWSTCYKVQRDKKVYIGKPIQNTKTYIVNDKLEPVLAGSSGELLIGGKGVAIGYYNNDVLTAKRFIILKSGDRVYRTGDLVKMGRDKNIEYINRIDNQIKIRGFRIEPYEIEQVLSKSPLVRQSVVVLSEINVVDMRLIAFYLGAPDSNDKLRDLCQKQLPAYMVPQHFICVTEFPMTANLKIDRKLLAKKGAEQFNGTKECDLLDPRDDLDRSLMKAWASLLGVEKISIDDNFFNLGGHSLLVLEALDEMKKVSGLDFDLSVFFETPTIRQIRNCLGKSEKQATSVVKLNNSRHGNPIFCMCGVQIYAELAEHYKNLRPVYGIFAPEEVCFINAEINNESINFSFDTLAETYKNAILRQGTHKAITLAGLSFGGLICLEVAKKLIAEGIVIHNIYLLDTYTGISTYRSFYGLIEDTFKYIFLENPFIKIKSALKIIRKRLLSNNSKRKKSNIHKVYRQQDREKAFDKAALVFKDAKKTYDFVCVLIKATKTNFGFGIRPYTDYRLNEYIKGHLHIHQIKADHEKMLAGECATIIFKIMQQYEPESAIIND